MRACSLYQEISRDTTVASKVWVLNESRGEGAMQLKGEKNTEYYRPLAERYPSCYSLPPVVLRQVPPPSLQIVSRGS